MPQLTTMVLKDQRDTDHSFKPRNLVNGIATLVEGTGVPIGDRKISIGVTRTAAGRHKASIRIQIPVTETTTVGGTTVTRLARMAYADCTFNFAGDSTNDERVVIWYMLRNALVSSTGIPVITDLEDMF